MKANAQKIGPDKYLCAYDWVGWIKTSKGKKEGVGAKHSQTVSLAALKSDVELFKKKLGRK